MTSPTNIIICADDPLVRAGLSAMLGSIAKVTIVAEADSSLLSVDDLWPDDVYADALVWDVGWAGVDEALDLGAIPLPVLALVGDDEQATDAWQAGPQGIIWRHSPEDDILTAVLALCAGFVVVSPGLTGILSRQSTMGTDSTIEDLTTREKQVLGLVAQGLTNKAIGQNLSISEHTVKFHINAILSKLGAQSRTDAVVKATRQGLISL